MSNLQIKDVPPSVHDELRRRARQAGMTQRDYVLDLIRREQAAPSRVDWRANLSELKPVDMDRPAAELIREERRQREQGLEKIGRRS